MKYVLRVIALPFVLALVLIGMSRGIVLFAYNFLRYGGETIAYNKTHNAASFGQVLSQLKELSTSKNE